MRIGVLKLGGIGDMCDCISFVRSIRKKWGEVKIILFTDCYPMASILSTFVDGLIITNRQWYDIFKGEAWKFNMFYDFRPHCCRVFSGNPYTQQVHLESDKDPVLMRRWKQYNSWDTNKLQDLKKSVIDLNLESAELTKVPYDASFELEPHKIKGDYITINIGAMGAERGKTQTKQWDNKYWQEVIDVLLKRYGLPIYQIGVRWERKLKRVHHVWGKPLLVVASLLKASKLHLGNENGMVRLRRLVTTNPSVVLFGPTSTIMYGFENNINIHSNMCRPCFWYTGEWMWKCAMDWNKICMTTITPEMVTKKACVVLGCINGSFKD